MDIGDSGSAATHSEDNIRQENAEDTLGRELASFAFLREEDDREVRLSFRDVPADSIAKAFHLAGAYFISLTGERARIVQPTPVAPVEPNDETAAEDDLAAGKRRRKRKANAAAHNSGTDPNRPVGELTMRYFFATENLVYTVIITSSTGIIESIANIYPSAQLSEREVQTRLAAIIGRNA